MRLVVPIISYLGYRPSHRSLRQLPIEDSGFGTAGAMSETQPAPGRTARALDFFERLGCGCILIDASGHVLRMNEYASRYIGRDLLIGHQRLAAAHPGCNPILQRLITAMLAADPQFEVAPGTVALHREHKHPLVLRVAPVVGPVHTAFSGAKGVITLIDPDDCLELPQDLLQAAYGLTPAEARVAQRVACGENPEEIADRHQVSPGTVRMQLKSIFQKTNTKRQAQLVSLLARLGRIR